MKNIDLARLVAHAASEKKAEEIEVQNLQDLSDLCSFQVICSGTTERQTQAICQNIEAKIKAECKSNPLAVEGKQTGDWILMDYGSVIAHIFTGESRGFYSLEKLWPHAQQVSWEG